MKYRHTFMLVLITGLFFNLAWGDEYDNAIDIFESANASSDYFDNCYGYALFPTVGKGGLGLGAAFGSGQVYVDDKYVGDTTMTQVSLGFQVGAQAFTQIIFFQDKQAFDTFTEGNFEFGAEASAVAITAGASARASTTGVTAGANEGLHNLTNTGQYFRGMAVFTVTKGGLMYEMAIGGQKFTYTPKDS